MHKPSHKKTKQKIVLPSAIRFWWVMIIGLCRSGVGQSALGRHGIACGLSCISACCSLCMLVPGCYPILKLLPISERKHNIKDFHYLLEHKFKKKKNWNLLKARLLFLFFSDDKRLSVWEFLPLTSLTVLYVNYWVHKSTLFKLISLYLSTFFY